MYRYNEGPKGPGGTGAGSPPTPFGRRRPTGSLARAARGHPSPASRELPSAEGSRGLQPLLLVCHPPLPPLWGTFSRSLNRRLWHCRAKSLFRSPLPFVLAFGQVTTGLRWRAFGGPAYSFQSTLPFSEFQRFKGKAAEGLHATHSPPAQVHGRTTTDRPCE